MSCSFYTGHLRDSIQNLISVKKERLKLEELNRLSHEMKLVDAGVDPRYIYTYILYNYMYMYTYTYLCTYRNVYMHR